MTITQTTTAQDLLLIQLSGLLGPQYRELARAKYQHQINFLESLLPTSTTEGAAILIKRKMAYESAISQL